MIPAYFQSGLDPDISIRLVMIISLKDRTNGLKKKLPIHLV